MSAGFAILPATVFLVVGIVIGSISTFMFTSTQSHAPVKCYPSTTMQQTTRQPTSTSTTTTASTTATTSTTTVNTHPAVPTDPSIGVSAMKLLLSSWSGILSERGFLCGNVEQEPIFIVDDALAGERRPHTRQEWIWRKNLRTLPAAWKELVDNIAVGDYKFANQGVMHAFTNFESNATYFCGLAPHNVMPWTVTFRTYEQWTDASKRAAPADAIDAVSKSGQSAPYAEVPRSRFNRYAPEDIAIGVYTALRFLRTRGHAVRDTFLARHPENRVFYFTGGNDSLGLFDVVAVAGAGESYNSAFGKQMHALKHMWEKASDAKWFYVIGWITC
jgi:hypothetical protein